MSNLMSAVDELFSVDVRAMPDAVLVDEIVDLAGQINRLSAAYLARLEVVDRRGGMAAEHGSTAAWLRAALRAVASRDVHLSRDLADVMPSVATAMADGEVSVAHAQVLAGLRKDLPDDVVRSVDPHLADGARTRTRIELRAFVTHVRHSYAPDAVVRDEREAYDERRLQASTTMYGTGVGDWTCDPVSHEMIMTAIHAASAPVADDDRTPAQRRLDGLLTVCEIALRSGELPDTGGVKPHVTVVVDLTTLAGREAAAAAGLAFGAAVSGDAARRIGCDADIARVIAGPAGEVLDSGRSTRTFTAAQRRRDHRARPALPLAGLRPPARLVRGNHVVHWARGGSTSVSNGVLLCGRHHDRLPSPRARRRGRHRRRPHRRHHARQRPPNARARTASGALRVWWLTL